MKNIEKSPALSSNTYGKYSLPIEYIQISYMSFYLPSLPREHISIFLYTVQPHSVCLNIHKGQSNFKLMLSNQHRGTSRKGHLGLFICLQNDGRYSMKLLTNLSCCQVTQGQDRPTSFCHDESSPQTVNRGSSHGSYLEVFVMVDVRGGTLHRFFNFTPNSCSQSVQIKPCFIVPKTSCSCTSEITYKVEQQVIFG